MANNKSQEQKRALKDHEERRKRNKHRLRTNNAQLYAGAPMYFYCERCGEEIVV